MTDSLTVRLDAGVQTLTLNRPALHNAFDAALIAALTEALRAAGEDPAVRCVVLAGEGRSFSAGADLNWMRAMAGASEADNLADALALAQLMRTLDTLPRPTLARIQGAAFGGGVGLIACCDIAIATRTSRFGLTESRLGLLPAVISPYVVQAIGARQSRRWFATGEHFTADTAQRMGLIHEVVDEDSLDDAVAAQLALLAQAGPVAAGSAKALVRQVIETTDAQQLDHANAALIARLRVSAEGQEGLAAFLERRSPAWQHPH